MARIEDRAVAGQGNRYLNAPSGLISGFVKEYRYAQLGAPVEDAWQKEVVGLRTVHAVRIDEELKALADLSRKPRRLDALHRSASNQGMPREICLCFDVD